MSNIISETSVTIDAMPAEVWKAITTPETIKKYLMGTTVTSDWKEGSPITYKGEYNGKAYEDKGVIKKIEPGKLFDGSRCCSTPERASEVASGCSPSDCIASCADPFPPNSTDRKRLICGAECPSSTEFTRNGLWLTPLFS